MNKPILVNNNKEWLDKLATVLENKGHTWGENCPPLQYNPFTSSHYSGGAIVISFGWGILSWRHFSENSGETQSVEEYLASQGHFVTEATVSINLAPDYKAKYYELLTSYNEIVNLQEKTQNELNEKTRAIEEAVAEMDSKIEVYKSLPAENAELMVNTMLQAKEILQKTGI